MTTFRKALMATTMLAGLAIFAFDTAQAGPNGPNIGGSISGFSSMRVDFNRVGGPNRALARDDMRVVPITVKNTDEGEKSGKATKSAAKKGLNTARVSNPKPVTGGKDKEDVSGGPNLHIPAALAEIYRITGGNLDDLAQIAALADQIKTGPLVVANPLFPAQGDGTFTPPEFAGGRGPKGGEQSDRNFLDGWAGYSSAPGGPDTSKTGWAGIWTVVSQRQGDGWRVTTYRDSGTGRTGTVTGRWGDGGSQREVSVQGTDSQSDNDWTVTIRHEDTETSHTRIVEKTEVVYGDHENEMAVFTTWTMTVKDNEGNVVESASDATYPGEESNEGSPKKKDSQPVEEGTGRPGRSGWCSPTGGCVIASPIPPRRIIPNENYQTAQTNSQLPSWATDPCPDCTSRGGSGGRTGYDPHDEGDGGPDNPSNPM